MPKHVLDVGQCAPDHQAICSFLDQHFHVKITQTDGPEDTLAELRSGRYDLVLINRKLDCDYSDGLEIIQQIKADAAIAEVAVMLVTNLAEHQDLAVAAGAERGFGKLEYDKPETVDRLRTFLA